VPGTVAGIAAFLGGYVLTFILKSGQVSELLTRSLGEAQGSGITPPGDWQVVGWFFFQMHTVGTETTLALNGQTRTGTTTGGVESWMFLIPIALLLAAGFVVARRTDASEILTGAQAGATVVVGYVLLAVVFAVLTTWSASVSALGGTASITIGPALVTGVLTAGMIYPLAVGAVGGAFAAATGQ
jgi:hypothetical protein